MPTSGGTGGEDPYARDGVGDGDAMVAATKEAFSFGPVDSQLFLDSEMPSLYDVFNDMYGEPPRPIRRVEKSQALDSSLISETRRKIAESKKSGRHFSTVRRVSGRRRQKELADKDAPAMLYVVGRTPAPSANGSVRHVRRQGVAQHDDRARNSGLFAFRSWSRNRGW